MLEAAHSLPDDIAALKAMVLASRAELAARDAELHNRDLLIEKLKHQLAGLRRQRFGATSEALDQLELGIEDEEIARAAEVLPEPPAATKSQPKRRPLPDHLPREETVLTPGDRCSACGDHLKRLGEDVTEELEYIPGRFVVKRIVRPRLACGGCEKFHQAPLPPRPIERGRPGPGLLAHVLVSKYCDHLPLYRQSRIFARDGIELDRSTLAGWVGKATALLEPLADAIGRHVLEGQALFADDTPVKLLAPGTGKTATGRAWTYVRDERPWAGEAPPAAWYRFSADRKAAHPKSHLAGFAGWMHTDGYAGFGALARAGPVREVACLAHVRRKFFDVHAAQGSAIAAEALERIAALYAIEKEARGQPPENRTAIRKAKAAPCLDELAVAANAAAEDLRQDPAGGGDPPCADPPQAPSTLYRARLPGDRQQPGRTRNEADRARPQELSLHGLGQRRQGRRHRLHPDRDRQAQRRQSAGLACRRPRTHPRLQDQPHRRAAALEHRDASRSGSRRLNSPGQYDRTLTMFKT